jgi:hypothetical protein
MAKLKRAMKLAFGKTRRAFSNTSGRITNPEKTVGMLESRGIPAKHLLEHPGKGVFTSEKKTRQYLADLARNRLGPGQNL